jgi:tetratricopeptide (TPR) repeat protein
MKALSRSDSKHLEALQGYLRLEMPEEALKELARLSPDIRDITQLLPAKLIAFQQSEDWDRSAQIAEHLAHRQVDNPDWYIAWADSVRRSRSLQDAERILREGMLLHPNHAMIHFHLACCAAQMGELEKASSLLARAIEIDPNYKILALDDPDLEPIRDSLL